MSKPTLAELLAIAEASTPHLIQVVEKIVEHPHREVLVETPLVELEELTEPETEQFLELVMNPGTISPAKKDTPVHFEYEGGKYQFTHVYDSRRRVSFDTYPNRYVRYFLLRYRNLLDRAGSQTHAPAAAVVRRIDGILGSSFLKDVTVLQHISTDHNVLRKDPNYREVLRADVALGKLMSRSLP